MKISTVTEITDKTVEALHRLLPQLLPSAQLPDKGYLEAMINSGAAILFVAEVDDKIVGTLTLAVYNTPLVEKKAWIEDVVTDENVRGKGIGRQLIAAALDYARKEGIGKVDLTSSNDKTAAHILYEKTGFKKRDTTVFRFEL